jgi:hypothetical protein
MVSLVRFTMHERYLGETLCPVICLIGKYQSILHAFERIQNRKKTVRAMDILSLELEKSLEDLSEGAF